MAVESQVQRKLSAGEFVVTAEVTPPLSADAAALLAKAAPLRGRVDAVNVTDAAGARAEGGGESGDLLNLPRREQLQRLYAVAYRLYVDLDGATSRGDVTGTKYL